MIYLQNNPEKQQTVDIPTSKVIAGAFYMSLFSTVDRREVFRALRFSNGHRLYVSVNIRVPGGLSDGEYEYRLTVGGAVTDSGVAVLGQYETEKQYRENFEYKQYGEGE